MKIRQLRLVNYRGFRGENTFNLANRFTVIAGINGRGKTSLLDGLASILARLLFDLRLSTGSKGHWKPTDINANAGSEQTWVIISAISGGVSLQGYHVVLDKEWSRPRGTTLTPEVKFHAVAAYGDPNRTEDQAPIASYYTTDRAGYRLPRSLPAELPSLQKSAYRGALTNRMVDYRDLMARVRMWSRQGYSRELKAFNYVINQFLDGFGEVVLEEEPLRLLVRKNGQLFSLQQLSDGERSFIAILGDLVRRLALANPELDDPLQGHGVVLIDEIELHLHPKWQREVVEKLRVTFPNIQFIATTHSPFVIQSLRPGELINLDPDEFAQQEEYAGKSIEDIAENVMGVEMPQQSQRYLDMVKAAEEYFRLLKEPAGTPEAIAAVEQRLNELSIPYNDDPAFQARLELEKEKQKNTGE